MQKTTIIASGAMLATLFLSSSLAAQVPAPQREANIARYCTSCATVQSLTRIGSGFQLTVRYASGKKQTLTYANDPGFRAGDKVRVNDGVLTRDD